MQRALFPVSFASLVLCVGGSAALMVAGCGSVATRDHGAPTTGSGSDGGTNGGGGAGGGGAAGGSTGGGGPAGGAPCTNLPATVDSDGDGYTPAQGDCNDCDPSINPGAIEIPGDGRDNDCNGTIDDALPACDQTATGKSDPLSLTQSIELCDPRFFKSAAMNGPSDARARNVLARFGVLQPKAGASFALLSNGVAVDEMGSGFVNPQKGTNLGNDFANPLPTLAGAAGCGPQAPVDMVHDYSELVLTLKAPSNVNSFSFQFQYFSGEYPNFVCSQYNDEFLAIVQSSKSYATPTNISFDGGMHPITVNSGFFTVCTDWVTPNTNHCTHPPTDNAGTGYETAYQSFVPGGSTGWLTTTAPIAPGEDITLRFVIFDEGDHILDSAVLIDNFRWGAATVTGPTTGPIS